jgi:hypothetical protein
VEERGGRPSNPPDRVTTKHRYRFTVLGRYPARLRGNEPAVTVNVAAGDGDHLVHCGSLTMSQPEWDTLAGALRYSLREDVRIEDDGAV